MHKKLYCAYLCKRLGRKKEAQKNKEEQDDDDAIIIIPLVHSVSYLETLWFFTGH